MSIGRELAARIAALLPSRTLREEIARREWKFTEEELLLITMQFCPLFSRRKKLLGQIVREADGKTAKWANACLAWEERKMEEFSSPGENEVYLLRISERGIPVKEEYVFKDFRSIPAFVRAYAGAGADVFEAEAEKVRFGERIDPKQLGPFLGICDLDKRGRVAFVREDGCEWGRCEEFEGAICSECKAPPAGYASSRDTSIRFPEFLQRYDIVKIRDFYTGEPAYGFIPYPIEDFAGEGYVICLGNGAERYAYGLPPEGGRHRKWFSNDLEQVLFDSHEHIPFPLLEKIGREKLPARFRRAYDKITADLRRLEKGRAESEGEN